MRHRRAPASRGDQNKGLRSCYSPARRSQMPHMFNVPYLNQLRLVEMERLLPYIPAGARVLEFGAGTGQQARFLADRKFDVVAVDLACSSYSGHQVFPVQDYDGEHIPLKHGSIDVIFSSNVLEHVENVPAIMSEFRRILRPSGFAIHVMPTPSWRLWTFVSGVANAAVAATHLPWALIRPAAQQSRWQELKEHVRIIAAGLLPLGHGTSVEGISELYTFSRRAWLKTFRKYGFEVIEDRPLGLFYTGHMLLRDRLPFSRRHALARTLGSATRIYIVKPRGAGA
jgi:SAM-dependent methyltransferase